ncbi:unnamed protein product, partial [Staurois parvus]
MSCQSAPGPNFIFYTFFTETLFISFRRQKVLYRYNAPGTFFIGFFECGRGHRGPMIPYCPGAP